MECGKIVCKSCITAVLAAGIVPTCPLCMRIRPEYWHDINRKQLLCGIRVYCSHKNIGCDWQGELGYFDKHLNENPNPERDFEGCKYTILKCKFCKDPIQRDNLHSHQKKKCFGGLACVVIEPPTMTSRRSITSYAPSFQFLVNIVV